MRILTQWVLYLQHTMAVDCRCIAQIQSPYFLVELERSFSTHRQDFLFSLVACFPRTEKDRKMKVEVGFIWVHDICIRILEFSGFRLHVLFSLLFIKQTPCRLHKIYLYQNHSTRFINLILCGQVKQRYFINSSRETSTASASMQIAGANSLGMFFSCFSYEMIGTYGSCAQLCYSELRGCHPKRWVFVVVGAIMTRPTLVLNHCPTVTLVSVKPIVQECSVTRGQEAKCRPFSSFLWYVRSVNMKLYDVQVGATE